MEGTNTTLAIAILVPLVLFLVGVPLVLLRIFGGRQAAMQAEMATTWRGVVLDWEHGSFRVRDASGMNSRLATYIEIRYRRDDGTEGSFRVAEEGEGAALCQSTLQPLAPPGLYDAIQTGWKQGDHIVKPAGGYYPIRQA